MKERMFQIQRKDGCVYGYLHKNDHIAQFVGKEGTPIKMTLGVAQKLLGNNVNEYTLVEAK